MRSFRTSEQNNTVKVVKDLLSLFWIRLRTDNEELGTRSEPWPFSEKRLSPNAKSGHEGSAAASGGRSPAWIGTHPAAAGRTSRGRQ